MKIMLMTIDMITSINCIMGDGFPLDSSGTWCVWCLCHHAFPLIISTMPITMPIISIMSSIPPIAIPTPSIISSIMGDAFSLKTPLFSGISGTMNTEAECW